MEMDMSSSSLAAIPSTLRYRLLEFLLHASSQLQCPPIVKYTALSFFADRFLPSLRRRKAMLLDGRDGVSWLLDPPRESNLQLFALISLWISSKMHDSRPLSVKSMKALGDDLITDQHFMARDYAEAAFGFEIGASNIVFVFLEDLLIQFRELSMLGELLRSDVCMEIMDLLYETEDMSMLFSSPCSLAASILVTAYTISIPKQRWEFPLLPWVKFVTSYDEDDIRRIVSCILGHVLKPEITE
ncbi:cyclin-J18-like isoform X2 [Phoenix dactylifera]|uniref:Cyclin-J18-like isoform X2 n=1 Tax=Phoenix dactylifera TaxID=42345 RepID=A0A8B9B3B1_PHODC|nr:cyclin-J18-like isoform X2 [Phoenix dactylifera]